jgi:hypothetical protein
MDFRVAEAIYCNSRAADEFTNSSCDVGVEVGFLLDSKTPSVDGYWFGRRRT